MNTLNRTIHIARRTLALSALLGASLVAAQAQQAAVPATSSQPTLNLQIPAAAPTATFSSSSENNEVAVAENHFDFLAATDAQPPSRRYGRPRYRGGNTNPDGSNKWAFLAGAGFTQPTGNTYHYLTPSWGFQVGAGRNFDRHFALMAQFDYDNFGFNGRTLGNQLNLYNTIIGYYNAGQPPANQIDPLASLDGHTHVWSFTLNPTYTFYSGEGMGAYVVGGVGYYHKVADFTTPGVGQYCDFFGFCYQYQANQQIDHYSSNAPGFSGGFGLTYKFSRFSNERLYGEVRYVYIVNEQRQGITIQTVNPGNAGIANDFPANSNRTSYIPVKFGIRF